MRLFFLLMSLTFILGCVNEKFHLDENDFWKFSHGENLGDVLNIKSIRNDTLFQNDLASATIYEYKESSFGSSRKLILKSLTNNKVGVYVFKGNRKRNSQSSMEYKIHVDSIIANNLADSLQHPNLTVWGGVTLFKKNEEIFLIKTIKNAEAGHIKTNVYLKDNVVNFISITKQIPNWVKFQKEHGDIDINLDKMTFINDTVNIDTKSTSREEKEIIESAKNLIVFATNHINKGD